MARISTHVLDLARGKPGSGIAIDLYFGDRRIGGAVTNLEGRTDEPLLSAEALEAGQYELVFHAGDYLRTAGESQFFDRIAVRFQVSNPRENYHVPLLLSPYGYTTYRGS